MKSTHRTRALKHVSCTAVQLYLCMRRSELCMRRSKLSMRYPEPCIYHTPQGNCLQSRLSEAPDKSLGDSLGLPTLLECHIVSQHWSQRFQGTGPEAWHQQTSRAAQTAVTGSRHSNMQYPNSHVKLRGRPLVDAFCQIMISSTCRLHNHTTACLLQLYCCMSGFHAGLAAASCR
jgi:hypothetical protein